MGVAVGKGIMSKPKKSYVILRCNKTLSCMKVIRDDATAPWEWTEKSADDFEDDLDALGVLMGTENTEGAEAQGARGDRDGQLNLLQRKGQEFVRLGKQNFRNDAGKIAVLKPLKVHSSSVSGKLREAEKVASAWEQVPTYVPTTGNTKAAFDTLLATCQAKYRDANDEGAEAREATGDTGEALMKLYRIAVDWYQYAIRLFPAGTSHGDLIRGEIPTEGGDPAAPTTPVITAEWSAPDNGVRFVITSEHWNDFNIERSDDAGATWYVTYTSTSADFILGDVGAGDHVFRVQARGDGGDSDYSNEVPVTVP
jgi:hypothetical protein